MRTSENKGTAEQQLPVVRVSDIGHPYREESVSLRRAFLSIDLIPGGSQPNSPPPDGSIEQRAAHGSHTAPSEMEVPAMPESSGVGPPGDVPHEISEEEDGPGKKRILARAMADRFLEEERLDTKAVFGKDPESVYFLERGRQTGIARIALETLEFYEFPFDMRDIVDGSVTDKDVQLDSSFAESADFIIFIQHMQARGILEKSLRGLYALKGPRADEFEDYRKLRLSAEDVVASHPEKELLDVFTDPELYKEAFVRMYGSVEAYLQEQKGRVVDTESSLRESLNRLSQMDDEETPEMKEDAIPHNRQSQLIACAKVAARARRMWGDAIDSLPESVTSWLPKLPLTE